MKCLSIFSSTPDLSYLWMDKTFKQHLIQLGMKVLHFIVSDILKLNLYIIIDFFKRSLFSAMENFIYNKILLL